MSAPGWPATLRDGALTLRPLRRRDASDWQRVRLANESHLAPWEPSHPRPWAQRHTRAQFHQLRRYLDREARAGAALPFGIELDGSLAGQVTISRIVRGVHLFGEAGYWLDREHTGRGVMSRALALVIDHALTSCGLHRVEVHIRPENDASLGVVRRLGLRQECFHPGFLHIDGQWRDHVGFAVTAADIPHGLAARTPPLLS